MSLLFGHRSRPPLAQQPTILHALRVQTSAYGGVVPVVFGQARVPGKLIWYGDFTPIPHTSTQAVGGKGGGGHKTETQTSYSYSAAVAIALAFGRIQGLYNVWDTKGKLAQQFVTEGYTVPGGGGTYTVSNSANYYDDSGVGRDDAYSVNANDYGDIPRTYSGTYRTRMQPVSTLTGAGQYRRPAAGLYQFHAADAGKTVYISYSYSVPDSTSNGVASSILNLSIFLGTQGQTAWPYLISNHPGQDLGYTNTAYVASSAMDLGNSGTLPNYTYEIVGRNPFGAGINDANPRDVINALLTDPLIGCQWPGANLGDMTAYSNYCVSNSLFISPVLDSQRPARDIISEILEATNSQCFFSEGLLKFVPYGDTTTIGNGAVYTPNTTPIYDLTDDDFLDDGNTDPVRILRSAYQDAYNDVKIEWLNRANSYNPEVLEEKDQSMIELYGLRPENTRQYHFITTQAAAAFAANTLLKRNVYIRKTYEFTLGWRYCLLEPMDLVTLTDSRLGLNKTPVRITQIEEDEDGKLAITAEEFPWGTATATLYPKQSPTSFAPDSQADAGSVNTPILYEPTARATDQQGYELWIGVSGSSPKYGGCSIWVSADNSSFKKIGVLYGSSRMGVVYSSAYNTSSDPDNTGALNVDLTQSRGILSSGSQADEDNFRTLCLVGTELISYRTATLQSSNKYSLTFLRRGVFGSAQANHPIGEKFLRIDDAVFKFQYDPQWIGQTVYFKFTSFNQLGQKEQSLANATSYSVTIAGVRGAIDDASGVLFGGQQGANASYRPLSNPLTASDVGSSATITIDPFTMRVSGTDLSIFSGSITALAYNTLYYVYYDDGNFSGGSVIFQATVTKEVALNNLGRYFVGSIRTPVSGAGVVTVGNNDGGAGAHMGNTYTLSPTLANDTVSADVGFVPIRNSYGAGDDADGNPATALLYSTAGTRKVAGFPFFFAAWTSLKLKIKTQVLSAGAQPMQVDYSLDNGATWANVYSVAAFGSRATTTDVITLTQSQHTGRVQVRYTTNASCNVLIYEAWMEGQI